MSFSHDASCPEISPKDCKEQTLKIPPHKHHQGLTMARLHASASFGLGQGWQIMGLLPIDFKLSSIDYTTSDGRAYTPPYGNIHHRNEALAGLGDGRVEVQHYTRIGESWVVGAGFGLTVPLGRTEEDPYVRAAKSETHQHMQMGTGTVDPVFSASGVWTGHKWGAILSTNGRLPMTDNAKGYRPSATIQTSAGPSYRFTSKLMMTSSLSFTREGQAEWSGRPDPTSGRTTILGGGALIFRFTPMLAAMVQAQTTVVQWSEETQVKQRFIGGMGLSWTPPRKGKAAQTR